MSHTHGPMEAARRQWWDGLSKQGDPMRIVNPLSSGFRAGWEAAGSINADMLESLKKIEELTYLEIKLTAEQILDIWKLSQAAIAKATGGDL